MMASVLIVHSKRTRRIILTAYVRATGIEPVVVSTCEDALGFMAMEPVDLVIVGAAEQAPGGISLAQHMRVRNHLQHIPVVLVVDHRAPFVALATDADSIVYTPLMYRDVMEAVLYRVNAPTYHGG